MDIEVVNVEQGKDSSKLIVTMVDRISATTQKLSIGMLENRNNHKKSKFPSSNCLKRKQLGRLQCVP